VTNLVGSNKWTGRNGLGQKLAWFRFTT
jgi:hypothetical protein